MEIVRATCNTAALHIVRGRVSGPAVDLKPPVGTLLGHSTLGTVRWRSAHRNFSGLQ